MHRRLFALTSLVFTAFLHPSGFAGPAPLVSILQSYDGVSYGATTTNSAALPPDDNGEPGPNYFVEFVNGVFAVHNKTNGTIVDFKTDLDFWASAGVGITGGDLGPSVSDPRVIFDPVSQRWFASQVDINITIDFTTFTEELGTNDFLLAVSSSADPTGPWKGFSISSDPTGQYFADFPTLGVDSQGVYLAGDMFNAADDPSTALDVGCSLLSIPKADLLASTPTVANATLFPVMSFSERGQVYQPATCKDGSALGNILAVIDIGNTSDPHSNLVTFSVQNLTGSGGATLSSSTFLTVAPYMVPDNPVAGVPLLTASQPDGSSTLQANDARFSARVYTVGGVMYATHSTELNGHIAIRWYRIDAASGALLESGTLADTNLDLFYPSIAANSSGVIVISYNASGSGTNSYIGCYAIAGQTDGGSTSFGTPILMKAGSIDYHGDDEALNGLSRWGDYSTTSVDPSDPNRFWIIEMYPTDTDVWTTRISELLTAPAVSLTIQQSGKNVSLSWPSGFAYQLQSAAMPSPQASWSNVTQTPATNNLQLVVTLPATSAQQFFRLKL